MKTISIYTPKGGTGKSTIAVQLAYYLEACGIRTLVIDLDEQADASRMLDAEGITPTAVDVLKGSTDISEAAAFHIDLGYPAIVTGDPSIAMLNRTLTDITTLQKALRDVKDLYNVAIIDNGPAAGPVLISALCASDYVLIPVMPEAACVQALTNAGVMLEEAKKQAPRLQLAGVIITGYDKRASFNRMVSETIRQTAEQLKTKLYTPAIRQDVKVKEAAALRQSIFQYAKRSHAAHDMAAVFHQVKEDIGL